MGIPLGLRATGCGRCGLQVSALVGRCWPEPVPGRSLSRLRQIPRRPAATRPPRNSSEAPPPVEMWLMRSATPAFVTAAIESPPPMIVVPVTPATASATALVPFANASISNTPIGPFQTTVFARPDHARRSAPRSPGRCRDPCDRQSRDRPHRASRAGRPPRASRPPRGRSGSSNCTPRCLRPLLQVARRVELVVLDERLADGHAAAP